MCTSLPNQHVEDGHEHKEGEINVKFDQITRVSNKDELNRVWDDNNYKTVVGMLKIENYEQQELIESL